MLKVVFKRSRDDKQVTFIGLTDADLLCLREGITLTLEPRDPGDVAILVAYGESEDAIANELRQAGLSMPETIPEVEQ